MIYINVIFQYHTYNYASVITFFQVCIRADGVKGVMYDDEATPVWTSCPTGVASWRLSCLPLSLIRIRQDVWVTYMLRSGRYECVSRHLKWMNGRTLLYCRLPPARLAWVLHVSVPVRNDIAPKYDEP